VGDEVVERGGAIEVCVCVGRVAIGRKYGANADRRMACVGAGVSMTAEVLDTELLVGVTYRGSIGCAAVGISAGAFSVGKVVLSTSAVGVTSMGFGMDARVVIKMRASDSMGAVVFLLDS
jgi:hypothetical protein